MPHIGNHVDAIFLPESVNTSTTLRINGGDLHLDDDKKLLLGNSDDFQIYYDGGTAHIDNNQGQIRMRAASSFLFYYEGSGGNEDYAKFLQNGAVELYHDGDKKFETISTGIDVTGLTETDTLNVSGTSTFNDSVDIEGVNSILDVKEGTIYTTEVQGNNRELYIRGGGSQSTRPTIHLPNTTNPLSILGSSSNTQGIVIDSRSTGAVDIKHNSSTKLQTTASGINVTGNDIKLLGPTSGSTFTTSTLTLRGYRQSTFGQFANIDFSNIDANSSNTEYLAARISAQLPTAAEGGELKFFVTPNNSTTITSTPAFTLHDDSSAEFASNLTVGGNLTVNGTTTTINSTTLTVDDLNIVLASGAADSAAANGAGITIDGANESLTWIDTNKSFKFSERLAIGSSTTQSANLRLSKNVGGENATTYYALLNNGLVQPDVTGTAYYNFVQVRTDGNSGTGYTISNLDAYSASVGSNTVHADTTITNLTGFEVKNTWIEGTNNYGFRGLIPSGTNRWNVYMDGSAPNYFAGNVGIGTNNALQKLHIVDNTSANIYLETKNQTTGSTAGVYFRTSDASTEDGFFKSAIVLEDDGTSWARGKLHILQDNTADDSNATISDSVVTIDQSGNVGIGTADPTKILHIGGNNSVQEIKYGHNSAGYFLSNTEVNRANANAAIHVYHYRWNGTKVAQMSVMTGDDTTNKDNGYFVFETANAGTTEERLRITADGNIGIGTNNPSTLLEVSKSLNPEVNIYSTSSNNSTATIRLKGARNSNNNSNVNKIVFENNSDLYEMAMISTQMGSGTSSAQHGELIFSTSNSNTLAEKMRIDNDGNVGINNDNPSAKLQVTTADTTYFKLTSSNLGDRLVVDQYGQLGLDTAEANISARLHITTASDMGILVEDMNGDTVFQADDASSNVVVGKDLYIGGTTNYLSSQPTGTYGSIQVNGSGKGNWEGYSIDGRAVFMHDGSTTMGLYDDVNNHWAIRHIMGATSVTYIRSGNNVDTITCDGSNNVGIGTATPGHKLNVYGNMVTENGASFGRGTLTADGQNNIYFFSQSATTNQAQSGAFHNKVRILGGSDQTRTLDLYQVDSGGAHIGSSYTSNNLTIDSAFEWVEFDQRVIIDSDNDSGGALRINNLVTNAEHDFYFAQEIVQTLSGSQTTTADREQGGIYMDINSTTTGGDTNHEHRAYGVYVDLDSTGDADAVYGVYANATATPTTGTSSEIAGVYGHGEDNGGAGNVSNVYGVRGVAISDNSTSDTNSLFGGHFKAQPAADTADIGAAYGVWGEIEIADNTGDHLGAAYVFRAEFDDNDSVSQTCNSYLYYGNYTGSNPTNSWGVYIADPCDNYFAGPIGIGVDTLGRGPLHIHQGTTGDTQIHMTNSETGTSSSDGFTIFQGAGSSGEDCGFVNREENGRIRFLMNTGPDMGGDPVIEDRMILTSGGYLGIKVTPTKTLDVNGNAYFRSRVGIGTTDHSSYQVSIKNAAGTINGMLMDCNDWSTNASRYGINLDIDSTNRTNLSSNRTHRGISCDIRARVAQNASNTSGTRQSIYGSYTSAYVDDTDNNDGKMYYVWANYARARVDGVNCANLRGGYFLAQAGDNATGQARTVDNAYGVYANMVNDGNETTFTNAYGVYANVNQDDVGGAMTNAYGVFAKLDRDGGTGGAGHLFRGDFDGTWSSKRGLWLTGDTENSVEGSFSKGSGSFKIPHPLPEKNETHNLVHSFVESPQANNIYRGKVTLVNGSATINLDTESTMTEGTFVLLNRDIHCFTSNESDWDAVRGSVSGNILTIECQNPSSTATVAWLVIGERHDQHMYDTGWTDENGKVIVEPLKPEPEPTPENSEMPD